MMRQGRAIFAMLWLALPAACTSVDEGNLIVQGHAVDVNAARYETCLLDTRNAAGATIDRRRVSGEFRETIIVAPGEATYGFAISCAGANETYQSKGFRVEPPDTVDLGRVTLKRP
jgi:hypothetical protein